MYKALSKRSKKVYCWIFEKNIFFGKYERGSLCSICMAERLKRELIFEEKQ